MRKLLFLSVIIVLFSLTNSAVQAQSVKPTVLTGEVNSLDSSKIVLQTKDGAIDVLLSDATKYKRVPPENPRIDAAVAATLTEVGVGDKIAVTGILSDDKKNIPANSVYIMTKADISKRNASDQEAWRTRSIAGRVVAINPAMQQFTVSVKTAAGDKNVVVSPKLTIRYRRYAPDSVKFDDAKESSLAEMKVGDQVRVLGDKGEDGATFRAERVVAGSFKTIAGTITAIDTAKNEVTIKNIQTGKPVTVTVNSNSIMKKFPAEFAQMMAMRAQGGGGMQPPNGGNGQGSGNAAPPPRPPQSTGQGQTPPNGTGQGGGGMRRSGDINDMLDRFPTITVADLKVGDAIAFSSSTDSADISHATAIKLVAGVEPFLRAGQTGGRRRSGGQDAGFSIPGLDDGIGAP